MPPMGLPPGLLLSPSPTVILAMMSFLLVRSELAVVKLDVPSGRSAIARRSGDSEARVSGGAKPDDSARRAGEVVA